MSSQPEVSESPWRTSDMPTAPVHNFRVAGDVLEAMLQSLEGGEHHARPPLDPDDPAFSVFIEIGIALRDCLRDPTRREYLIERLKPHRNVIISTLPAGIQRHGLLPEPASEDRQRHQWRILEEISEDELHQWIIDDGRLIYGEMKRYELQNYFDAIAPRLKPGSIMYDLGSGLGKVVMSAAIALPVKRCVGVELLPYRHRMAEERLQSMLAIRARGIAALPEPLHPDSPLTLSTGIPACASHLLNIHERILFIQQDMFKADISDAGLVFIYSTCFGALMDALGEKLARDLPEHCLVSCMTFPLKHPALQLLHHYPSKTLAWTSVYLYERVGRLDTLPAPPPVHDYPSDADKWEAEARRAFAEYDKQT